MDWPNAVLLLGVLGTIMVAIIKFVPQKTVIETHRGEKCATKDDIRAILSAIHEHQKYSEQRNHDILNGHGTIVSLLNDQDRNMVRLQERLRRRRDDDDTN